MQVNLDVASYNSSQRPYKLVNLPWVGTANGISNADSVHTDLVDGLVDREEVDEVGTERILCRETDFDSLGLDEFDDFDSGLGDISHILSVREFPEEGRCADNDIDTVNTWS